jgi:hypothetical protein
MEEPELLGFDSHEAFETYFSSLVQAFIAFMAQDQMFKSDDSNQPEIISLLYEDLCVFESALYDFSFMREVCKTDLASFYKKGISGVLNNLDYLLTSYASTLDTRNETS